MNEAVDVLVVLILIEHLIFLILEMFLWTRPIGMKIFLMTKKEAEATKVLASNQGLYNGFLSMGLIWALLYPDPELSKELMLFFLGCISIAGIYGGISVKKIIFYIQALPALICIILILIVSA